MGEQVESTREFLPSGGAGRYRANVEALSRFQPDVAGLVEDLAIPDDMRLVVGRDGRETFLLPSEGALPTWLGGSSMPSVSVPQILASFQSEGSNVALPGVQTGLEAIAVANKCPSHVAVFVVEPDPLLIKLAMYLYDYTLPIDSGRVVFLAGPDLQAALRSFLQAHCGYELPRKLVTVPQVSTQQVAELQRELQVAGESVVDIFTSAVDERVAALAARRVGATPETPRVAVVGVDPRRFAIAHGTGVASALSRLGWTHETCVPDRPSACHTAARISAVERVRADLVLFASGCADRFRALVPADLPVVAWYPPAGHVPEHIHEPSRGHDLSVACSSSQRDRLVAAGVSADDVEICGLAVDDTTFRPVSVTAEDRQRWGGEIAVLMDLPDDRPESAGVNLPSHVALWQAMRDGVLDDPEGYSHDRAGERLAEAERASGTALDDSKTREHFLGLLRARIAPACIARAQVSALVAKYEQVVTFGANWPPRDGGPDFRRGPIPFGEELNTLSNCMSVVVLPASGSSMIQLALCAMAAGIPVVCRGEKAALLREYPGLESIERFLHLYEQRRELTRTVGQLLSSSFDRQGMTSSARDAVLAQYTFRHRVEYIADCVRRRQQSQDAPGERAPRARV